LFSIPIPASNPKTSHARWPALHREEIRGAQKDRRGQDGGHRQYLRAAQSAQLPGKHAGEPNQHATCGEAQDTNSGGREAEECLGNAGLHGNERRLIHIAPSQVMPADEVIELIAKEAVAEVTAPEGADEMDEERKRAEECGENQCCAEWTSRGDSGIGILHGLELLCCGLGNSTPHC
jgi:hypothetical protein